jgi:hypothetical protein
LRKVVDVRDVVDLRLRRNSHIGILSELAAQHLGWLVPGSGLDEDELVGDRFWGQVRGSSGRLRALRVRVMRAREIALLRGW